MAETNPLTSAPLSLEKPIAPGPSSEPPYALRISGLRRRFGTVAAVDGLDLQVRPGEIYGFLGVNGAGKTTTIRMLMGIISPDGGTIELLGRTTRRTSLRQKRQIGYVSQEQVFYPWMTAQALGRFVSGFYPTWDHQEFARLLRIMEVPPDRKVSSLSGGMKAKLALALALAPRPALLILDEPTAGLDPVARREFLDIITHQARNYQRTTFFSSHLLHEVERTADRVGIIHQGRMRFEGGLDLLRDRVRQLTLPAPDGSAPAAFALPPGFSLWKELPAAQGGPLRLVLDAPPEAWASASWPPGAAVSTLPLDDIFIACVGVSTAHI